MDLSTDFTDQVNGFTTFSNQFFLFNLFNLLISLKKSVFLETFWRSFASIECELPQKGACST